MAAEFTVWDIKKELEKKLINYQQIITKPRVEIYVLWEVNHGIQ